MASTVNGCTLISSSTTGSSITPLLSEVLLQKEVSIATESKHGSSDVLIWLVGINQIFYSHCFVFIKLGLPRSTYLFLAPAFHNLSSQPVCSCQLVEESPPRYKVL